MKTRRNYKLPENEKLKLLAFFYIHQVSILKISDATTIPPTSLHKWKLELREQFNEATLTGARHEFYRTLDFDAVCENVKELIAGNETLEQRRKLRQSNTKSVKAKVEKNMAPIVEVVPAETKRSDPPFQVQSNSNGQMVLRQEEVRQIREINFNPSEFNAPMMKALEVLEHASQLSQDQHESLKEMIEYKDRMIQEMKDYQAALHEQHQAQVSELKAENERLKGIIKQII